MRFRKHIFWTISMRTAFLSTERILMDVFHLIDESEHWFIIIGHSTLILWRFSFFFGKIFEKHFPNIFQIFFKYFSQIFFKYFSFYNMFFSTTYSDNLFHWKTSKNPVLVVRCRRVFISCTITNQFLLLVVSLQFNF